MEQLWGQKTPVHHVRLMKENKSEVLSALLPIASVLTDLGLFNRPFGHFGPVLGLFFCQKGLYLFQLGHIRAMFYINVLHKIVKLQIVF